MRIVFIGAVQFSERMLSVLVNLDVEVVGVVTSCGAGINADYVELEPLCDKHNIPIRLTDDINSRETIEWISSKDPNIIFCLGWSRLLKKELLTLAPLGVIGYHPAALPKNRGRHPIIWALVLGLKKTASTFFFMDEGADTGDIVSQRYLSIRDEDNAASLYKKLGDAAGEQLIEIVEALNKSNLERIPQDNAISNNWRKRNKADGEIDWRMSSVAINNLVRALAKPYVGAHFVYDGKEYKVWKSRLIDPNLYENIEPGKVVWHPEMNKTIIKCGEGSIELLDVEPAVQLKEGEYL